MTESSGPNSDKKSLSNAEEASLAEKIHQLETRFFDLNHSAEESFTFLDGEFRAKLDHLKKRLDSMNEDTGRSLAQMEGQVEAALSQMKQTLQGFSSGKGSAENGQAVFESAAAIQQMIQERVLELNRQFQTLQSESKSQYELSLVPLRAELGALRKAFDEVKQQTETLKSGDSLKGTEQFLALEGRVRSKLDQFEGKLQGVSLQLQKTSNDLGMGLQQILTWENKMQLWEVRSSEVLASLNNRVHDSLQEIRREVEDLHKRRQLESEQNQAKNESQTYRLESALQQLKKEMNGISLQIRGEVGRDVEELRSGLDAVRAKAVDSMGWIEGDVKARLEQLRTQFDVINAKVNMVHSGKDELYQAILKRTEESFRPEINSLKTQLQTFDGRLLHAAENQEELQAAIRKSLDEIRGSWLSLDAGLKQSVVSLKELFGKEIDAIQQQILSLSDDKNRNDYWREHTRPQFELLEEKLKESGTQIQRYVFSLEQSANSRFADLEAQLVMLQSMPRFDPEKSEQRFSQGIDTLRKDWENSRLEMQKWLETREAETREKLSELKSSFIGLTEKTMADREKSGRDQLFWAEKIEALQKQTDQLFSETLSASLRRFEARTAQLDERFEALGQKTADAVAGLQSELHGKAGQLEEQIGLLRITAEEARARTEALIYGQVEELKKEYQFLKDQVSQLDGPRLEDLNFKISVLNAKITQFDEEAQEKSDALQEDLHKGMETLTSRIAELSQQAGGQADFWKKETAQKFTDIQQAFEQLIRQNADRMHALEENLGDARQTVSNTQGETRALLDHLDQKIEFFRKSMDQSLEAMKTLGQKQLEEVSAELGRQKAVSRENISVVAADLGEKIQKVEFRTGNFEREAIRNLEEFRLETRNELEKTMREVSQLRLKNAEDLQVYQTQLAEKMTRVLSRIERLEELQRQESTLADLTVREKIDQAAGKWDVVFANTNRSLETLKEEGRTKDIYYQARLDALKQEMKEIAESISKDFLARLQASENFFHETAKKQDQQIREALHQSEQAVFRRYEDAVSRVQSLDSQFRSRSETLEASLREKAETLIKESAEKAGQTLESAENKIWTRLRATVLQRLVVYVAAGFAAAAVIFGSMQLRTATYVENKISGDLANLDLKKETARAIKNNAPKIVERESKAVVAAMQSEVDKRLKLFDAYLEGNKQRNRESFESFEREIARLREHNRIRVLENEAIEDSSRAAYESLMALGKDTRYEEYSQAAKAALSRIHVFYRNLDRRLNERLFPETAEPDMKALEQAPSSEKIIFYLTHDPDWRVRARAAEMLGGWKGPDVAPILLKSAKNDPSLDVTVKALAAFAAVTGYDKKGNLFDVAAAEAWWDSNGRSIP